MKPMIEIFSAVSSLNVQAGDSLKNVALTFESKMEGDQLNEWASLCESVAASGWHGWEAAAEYIQLSKNLYAQKGFDFLMEKGRIGLVLSEYSFDPALTYYSGLAGMIRANRLELLSEVEVAVEQVRSRYSQASNLLVETVGAGFAVAANFDNQKDIHAWGILIQKYAEPGRSKLDAFLNSSQGHPSLPWKLLLEMSRNSLRGVSELVKQYPRISALLDMEELEKLEPLFLDFGNDGEAFRLWLDVLPDVLVEKTQEDRLKILKLMTFVPDADLARRLLNQSSSLPLNKDDVTGSWIEEGLKVCEKNRKAGEAWFDLESVSGNQNLQLLEGRVMFPDCQRLFHLFSEAMIGTKLVIDTLESQEEENYRKLPFTDGTGIYLPDSISVYENQKENFFLYKMTLLHQLGFYEFGTFNSNKNILPGSFSTYFSSFLWPKLAESIFNILEDARIDWLLFEKYKGLRTPMSQLMKRILDERARRVPESHFDQLLEVLIRFSMNDEMFKMDKAINELDQGVQADMGELVNSFRQLKIDPTLPNSLEVTRFCYQVLEPYFLENNKDENSLDHEEIYEPVSYRGMLDMDAISLRMQILQIEESVNEMIDGEETLSLSSMVDPDNIKIDELKKGEVQEAMGMFLTELEQMIADEDLDMEKLEEGKEGMEALLESATKKKKRGDRFYYDEWDCLIDDYRRQWCTLYEMREMEEEHSFVQETLKALPAVAAKVRRQLQMLKPEMLRKVKAMQEGEDLDMEKVIESVVDRKSGRSPDNNFYIQRTRKERDVSALFLLDMSASTDDIISTGDKLKDMEELSGDGGIADTEDILDTYYATMKTSEKPGKRIIDIEKEAAVLMAEALEDLGDMYSICGFSGYGREKVDYYVFKDFDEKYNLGVKGKIGGIKPCRSTRMGPAIRHALRSLVATESRIKSLIILSDGYPQDYDYGHDRNDRDYGLQDTTKALSEARQKGIQSFCLTVDPSGHDYLRNMCPDNQYMVIQDIEQLPHELSKVYRSLTG